MLKIGNFSKLSGLSIETLYYYEKIGLLKPFYIDAETNYRYYASEQLATVNKILVFKDTGFSLQQIADVINQDPSPDELVTLLDNKVKELEEKIVKEQQHLKRVKTAIQLFKDRCIHQFDEISVKRVNPLLVASLRSSENLEPNTSLENMWNRLNRYVNSQGSRASKSSIVIHHNVKDITQVPLSTDFELAVPISRIFKSCDTIKVYWLEEVHHMACVMIKNSIIDTEQLYSAVTQWMEKNKYHFAHSVREIYHDGVEAESIQSRKIVEIQFPIKGNF